MGDVLRGKTDDAQLEQLLDECRTYDQAIYRCRTLMESNAALLSALRESQSIITAGFRPTVEDIERWDAVIKEAE